MMLHRVLAPSRLILLIGLLAASSVVLGAFAATDASAARQICWMQAVHNPDNTISYVRRCKTVEPGEPGGPGSSGGGAPTCQLDKAPTGTGYGSFYCVGKAVCTIKDNWVPYAPPTEPAPPGHEWKLQLCWPCGGCFGPPAPSYILDGPVARPLIVQAQEAFGNLAPPEGEVRHSPAARGIVSLPTWFWLDPGSFGVVRGSSAEGLVAVAEPESTEWSTGDGGSVTCEGAGTPYTDGASSQCTHTYTRASARYDGSVTRTWRVHYEQGGNPVDIAGAPDNLTDTTDWALAVAEAQVLTGPSPGPGR
jgi:hypothetical protein